MALAVNELKILKWQLYIHTYVCISRLTVVSRAAKQSRTGDTTMCYIHERSILIERSPQADCNNQPYEKTTRDTKSAYNH